MKLRTTLRDKTLQLLKNRPVTITLEKIAEDTGLGTAWLSMFHNERIAKPNVNAIQTLYEYLTNSEIKV